MVFFAIDSLLVRWSMLRRGSILFHKKYQKNLRPTSIGSVYKEWPESLGSVLAVKPKVVGSRVVARLKYLGPGEATRPEGLGFALRALPINLDHVSLSSLKYLGSERRCQTQVNNNNNNNNNWFYPSNQIYIFFYSIKIYFKFNNINMYNINNNIKLVLPNTMGSCWQ